MNDQRKTSSPKPERVGPSAPHAPRPPSNVGSPRVAKKTAEARQAAKKATDATPARKRTDSKQARKAVDTAPAAGGRPAKKAAEARRRGAPGSGGTSTDRQGGKQSTEAKRPAAPRAEKRTVKDKGTGGTRASGANTDVRAARKAGEARQRKELKEKTGAADAGGDGRAPRRRREKMPPKDTPEGKQRRWERYQRKVDSPAYQEKLRKGEIKQKPLAYEGWSSKYETAIYQSERGDAAVKDYKKRNNLTEEKGWSEQHSFDVGGGKRRMDLFHEDMGRGIEYKSGSVPNDKKTQAQIQRDAQLIKADWDIKWVFKQEPAPWLRGELARYNIPWERDSGAAPK
jgi:hypothetical protein